MSKCRTCDNMAAVFIDGTDGYCGECVKVGRVSLLGMARVTAQAGSLEDCTDWWRDRVEIALMVKGTTRKEFDQMVLLEESRAAGTEPFHEINEEAERNDERGNLLGFLMVGLSGMVVGSLLTVIAYSMMGA